MSANDVLEKRVTIAQVDGYPDRMSWDLATKFADIPSFDRRDTSTPEWKPTPVCELDLTSEGYGIVYIKDESSKESNPTGTIKDRMAWEIAKLYRDFGRALYMKKNEGLLNGNIGEMPVPHVSLLSAGNAMSAIEHVFNKYDLPPPNFLVALDVANEHLEFMKKMRANIFAAPIDERALTGDEIKTLTGTKNGMDITSCVGIEPQAAFYDWHVHEVFNEEPDNIFVGYGSGRIYENFVTWQSRTLKNYVENNPDSRLKTSGERVIGMNILGAEPKNHDSVANKLTKPFNPFSILDDREISSLKDFQRTNSDTGIYQVPEEYILNAYYLLKANALDAEPSGAAALGLYLFRHDKGMIRPDTKNLVVNSGKGLYSEPVPNTIRR